MMDLRENFSDRKRKSPAEHLRGADLWMDG